MPFGQIYGAVFFLGICGWLGARLALAPGSPWKSSGACLALLGAAIAVGLLQRRSWARWLGALAAVALAAAGLRMVGTDAGLAGDVLLLSSAAAAVLLLVPATGDPQRGPLPGGPARAPARGVALWAALVAVVGLGGSAWWASSSARAEPAARSRPAAGELPAAAVARGVRWEDFGSGLARARKEGKPMLATFVTGWCPYCKKMRSTWNEPSVAARLEDLVAVRVDADEEREQNGFAGRRLAERYGIEGLPAQILLDGEGRVLSRFDGYQTTGQLLGWLDSALSRTDSRSSLGLRSAAR